MNTRAAIRKEIKAEQKKIIKAHYKQVLGAQVLYVVPMLLIAVISIVTTVGNMEAAMNASFSSEIMQASNAMSNSSMIVGLLELVIGAPLMLGLMSFYIQLMRGEEPSVSTVFQPFTALRTVWRSVRMSLSLFMRGLLLVLAPMVLFSVLFATIMVGSAGGLENMSNSTVLGVAGLYLALLVGFLILSVKMATYQLGYIRLHDNEFITTWDATREGSEAFRGRFRELLLFFLSFLPWGLLYFALCSGAMLPMIVGIGATGGEMVGAAVGGLAISLLLLLVVSLLLGSFTGAYVQMSLFRLFERTAPAPQQPLDLSAFQIKPMAGGAPQQSAGETTPADAGESTGETTPADAGESTGETTPADAGESTGETTPADAGDRETGCTPPPQDEERNES